MYQFRSVTPRIERYREKVRNRLIIGDAAKEKLKYEAEIRYQNFPPMVQKPMISKYVIENMPIDIQEDEFFVGDMGGKNWGDSHALAWVLMADIEHTWPILEDGLHHAPMDDPIYSKQLLAIAPEDVKELREIINKKIAANDGIRPEEWLPDGAQEFFALQASDYGKIGGWPVMLPPGHLTPGFQNLLRRGYADIRKEAQDWLDAHEGNVQGDNMGRYMFYKAATIACDTAILLTRRYADLAREKAASCADAEKKAEFEKMAEGLDWIAEKPARNFWEAL